MIVYGVRIKSDIDFPIDISYEAEANHELDLLSQVPQKLKDAITSGFLLIKSKVRSVYLHSSQGIAQELKEYVSGQVCCYEVQNVVRFYWEAGKRTIYYELDAEGDSHLLSFWFIQQFLPLYLSFEQMYNILHAGAIEIERRPVLFTALSMGGKSTMVDYFLKKGHVLISDDKIATFKRDNKIMAVTSHPYHRPYRAHEVFGNRADKIMKGFKPIHSIYLLEKLDRDADTVIEEIYGFEKFTALLPNYMYNITQIKCKQMKFFANMLSLVRVFRLKRPWGMENFEEIYHTICDFNKRID